MRASRQEQIGGAGVSEVSAAFERLGWGVAENSRHDLGTDLFVLARDERLFDLGLVAGVQVKSGGNRSRYFRERVRDSNGGLRGWWFRDEDRRHVDAWVSHALPHLIVLHNLDTRTSYWAHVTAETVVSAGRGAKVLVPLTNTIDDQHRDALLRVAASTRPAVTWERSAWVGAGSLAPRDVLRHALVVPRLIAPHPNAGYVAMLTAGQAVALLVQGRVHDLYQFSVHHAEVPTLEEAAESGEWEWRFVSALAHRVTTGDISRLLGVAGGAPSPAARAAATVTAVGSLVEEGRVDEAVTLLEEELGRDECEPVDHAWLTLQHARVCAEIGRLEQARAEVVAAQMIQVTNPDDVTATAIAGAAAELLFNTSAWGRRDVKDVVTGADNAASWWRTQSIAEALTALADRSYKAWARDRTVVELFGGTDTVNDQLLSASFTANYLGDQREWRHLAALLGRDMLLRFDRNADPEHAQKALETARLAGDDDAVKRAVRRLVADGPATAVTAAASNMRLESATRTTGRADLALLRYGGDVLDEETADRFIVWLLDNPDGSTNFAVRTTPSYRLDLELIDVLAAVIPAATLGTAAEVTARIADLPGISDQALATAWARVVDALPEDAWTAQTALRVRSDANGHHDALRLTLLKAITPHDEAARELLLTEARNGLIEALSSLGDVRNLPADIVATAVASLSASVEQRVNDARLGRWDYGPDVGQALAVLNIWHPASADWDPLFELLDEDAVGGGHKIAAFQILTSQSERIPQGVKARLGQIAKTVSGKPSRQDLPPPIGGDAAGPAANLALALGILDAESMAGTLISLLAGDHDQQESAARNARGLGSPEGIGVLVTLAESTDTDVRATAAANIASLVTAGHGNAITMASLRHCTRDRGTRVPAAIAATIANSPTRSPEAQEILAFLRNHPSARVRRLVTRPFSQ